MSRLVICTFRWRLKGRHLLDLVAEPPHPLHHLLFQRQARVVRPDGDAHGYFAAAMESRAAWTTASVLNPNFFCSSLSGAEAPKLRIPTIRPCRPV